MPPQPTPGDDDRRRGDDDENSQRNYGEPSESVDGEEHELVFFSCSGDVSKKKVLRFSFVLTLFSSANTPGALVLVK